MSPPTQLTNRTRDIDDRLMEVRRHFAHCRAADRRLRGAVARSCTRGMFIHSRAQRRPRAATASDARGVDPLIDVAADPATMAFAQTDVMRPRGIDASFAFGCLVVQR